MSAQEHVLHARARVFPPGWSPYTYVPSQSAGIAMMVVFAISTFLHTGKAIYFRRWWLFLTVIFCGVLETLGWAGRLWSHYDVQNMTAFQMQITCLVLAPTPLLAATFVLFGQIIAKLGPIYSRLTPKYYTIVFLSCDLIALVIQGAGGGVAATANSNGGSHATGSNIMLGGIIFQLVVMIVFTICAGEYIVRYLWDIPFRSPAQDESSEDLIGGRGKFTGSNKMMLWALAFSTVMLLIRAVYRTIELEDGWGGEIMANEPLFIVLDGVMIILAMYILNIVLPFWFTADQRKADGQASKY